MTETDCMQTAKKPTIGQLCQAISDGTLPAQIQGGEWYVVQERDLRRVVATEAVRSEHGALWV